MVYNAGIDEEIDSSLPHNRSGITKVKITARCKSCSETMLRHAFLVLAMHHHEVAGVVPAVGFNATYRELTPCSG